MHCHILMDEATSALDLIIMLLVSFLKDKYV